MDGFTNEELKELSLLYLKTGDTETWISIDTELLRRLGREAFSNWLMFGD